VTPAPAPPPTTISEDPMPMNSHGTPQPTLSEDRSRTPASEAGTSGLQQDVHRKRALAEKKLELSRARNRAAELEARNKADEIQQEIDIETEFGDVIGSKMQSNDKEAEDKRVLLLQAYTALDHGSGRGTLD